MIRTRPEGKAEYIKPTATRAKPNSKKLSKESEVMMDKSPSPNKSKTSSNLSEKIEKVKTSSPVSPIKTKNEDVKMVSPKQIASDTSSKSTPVCDKHIVNKLVKWIK